MQETDRPEEAAAQQGDQDLAVIGCIPFQGSTASCAAHADPGPCHLAPAHAVKFRRKARLHQDGKVSPVSSNNVCLSSS